ncbi:ABC transporter permease subunit [Streptomyces sp. NPDC048172]|uniref:ABC transporter permease subunit n=1 Tax=Streptomyces sp. NPDC048172 TaxID=3365505 RepID=UPI003712CE65
MSGVGFARAVVGAEWLKIRSVRSSLWSLGLAFALSSGLGTLIALNFRSHIDRVQNFDPVFAGLISLMLGQLALVAFGVLLIGSEYGSGTIRASLAAVPRRGAFFGGKVLVCVLTAFPVAVVTVAVTFAATQKALGPYGTTAGADGVLPGLVGACVYLTLICVFALGVATALRSSALALGILLPLLFLGSQGLGNVPKLKTVLQFLPDQAGMELIRLTGPGDDPQFAHAYGPWGALAILLAWTGAALVGGYLRLTRQDA